MLMVSDNETQSLVRKAQAGDRKAFGDLFRAYRQALLDRIRARTGKKLKPGLDPEDVLQETFLRAFETIVHFTPRGPDSFFHWVASIAEHLILNASQKRRPEALELKREPQASTGSPGKGLRRKERLGRLEAALSTLTPDQKEAVLLARLEGLSTAEIARRQGRSEEAVRQLISRGLKRLRKSMGSTESFHLPNAGL